MIYEIGSDDNGLVCLMMAGSRRQLKNSGCIQGKWIRKNANHLTKSFSLGIKCSHGLFHVSCTTCAQGNAEVKQWQVLKN